MAILSELASVGLLSAYVASSHRWRFSLAFCGDLDPLTVALSTQPTD